MNPEETECPERAVPKCQYIRNWYKCGTTVKILSGILVVYEEREE